MCVVESFMTALGQGLKITYLLAPSALLHVSIMWDHWFNTDSEGRVPHSESLMPYPAAL